MSGVLSPLAITPFGGSSTSPSRRRHHFAGVLWSVFRVGFSYLVSILDLVERGRKREVMKRAKAKPIKGKRRKAREKTIFQFLVRALELADILSWQVAKTKRNSQNIQINQNSMMKIPWKINNSEEVEIYSITWCHS